MATTASDVAKAVKALLGFSSVDQPALLEVFQDYFSSPDGPEVDDWDDDDNTDDEFEASEPLQGTVHFTLQEH